jgi:hypothetical protein
MELGIGFDDLDHVATLVDPERKTESTVLLRHGTKEDVLTEGEKAMSTYLLKYLVL